MQFRFFKQSDFQAVFFIAVALGVLFLIASIGVILPEDPSAMAKPQVFAPYHGAILPVILGMVGAVLVFGLLAAGCFLVGFNNDRYIRLCKRFGYDYE